MTNNCLNYILGDVIGWSNLCIEARKETDEGKIDEDTRFTICCHHTEELKKKIQKELARFERDLRKEIENETTLHK